MHLIQSRRAFLSTISFTSCGLLRAQTKATSRKSFSVAGKKVRVIDIHAHCLFPEAAEMMGNPRPIPGQILGSARLQMMDEQGIDMEALSINPFWYGTNPELSTKLIDLQTEKLYAWCNAHSDRFVAFAPVALQFPEMAARQLEHAVKEMGFKGAAIGGNVNGEEISAERFAPFWAKAQELDALIFIHPQGLSVPDLQKRLQGNGFLVNVIGNPLETTVALSHLIFDGTLDQFPGLKICGAHGGGYLPSYADRSDQGCRAFPQNCSGQLKKKPTEYLRQLYVDSLVFTAEGLRHLTAVCGSSQILLGTDHPNDWTHTSAEHILNQPGLTNVEKTAMLGGTAAKLLKL
jgi:aminocarboxymuconate-semialdehyde decarboxylase